MHPTAIHNPPAVAAEKATRIYRAMLEGSVNLKEANFKFIDIPDLQLLFDGYDRVFFDGQLARMVEAKSHGPVSFRLSSTMSRAGGKLIRTRTAKFLGHRTTYQIAIASRLLFMTFGQIDRPVVVCGLLCSDRLQALQRIFEHEIVHLIEMLTWGKSSCSGERFQTLARNIFGHTDSKHDLVTPRETAATQHGIRVGDGVVFYFRGVRQVGMVNRISHRATVLVESAKGMRYSNGKRYVKYYIPVGRLKRVE